MYSLAFANRFSEAMANKLLNLAMNVVYINRWQGHNWAFRAMD